MINIAISGQARTGKNTFANFLKEEIIEKCNTSDPFVKIIAIADPIKNIVMEMIPDADRQCLWGDSELRSNVLPNNLKDLDGNELTYRKMLIDIGTLGRKYHPDIWVHALIKSFKEPSAYKSWIISDVRFINEINYLKSVGFHLVRLKRNDIPQINDVSETLQLNISDSAFDNVIENNGSLDDLYLKAKEIVNKLV